VVKISAVTWGTFDEQESKTVPKGVSLTDKTRIRKGDLLISRANTLELVGATVLVEDEPGRELHLSDKVLRLDVAPAYRRWIQKYLSTASARREIEAASSGNQLSMRNISQAAMLGLRVPICPLNEQRRIVARLDELTTRSRAAREALDAISPLLKRIRQSVLGAAFRGDLTADFRAARGYTVSDWETVKLGTLVKKIEAGLNVRCQEVPPTDGQQGLVKISAVTWGLYNDNESKTLPNEHKVSELTRIQLGDFLISRANTIELVGACVIVHKVTRPVFLSDKVLRLVLPDDYKPWLLHFLRSPAGRRQIESRASGNQLSMRNLSQESLRAIEIPLPPNEERSEILARIESYLACASDMQVQGSLAAMRLKPLIQSILHSAFTGNLVQQDPSDEPASVALDRIRAERASQPRPTRSRKERT